MIKRIHLTLENDDFKQLKRDKDELKLTWESYVTMLSYPEIRKEITKIVKRREARPQAKVRRTKTKEQKEKIKHD